MGAIKGSCLNLVVYVVFIRSTMPTRAISTDSSHFGDTSGGVNLSPLNRVEHELEVGTVKRELIVGSGKVTVTGK